jgi:hypothetical protein
MTVPLRYFNITPCVGIAHSRGHRSEAAFSGRVLLEKVLATDCTDLGGLNPLNFTTKARRHEGKPNPSPAALKARAANIAFSYLASLCLGGEISFS